MNKRSPTNTSPLERFRDEQGRFICEIRNSWLETSVGMRVRLVDKDFEIVERKQLGDLISTTVKELP